MVEQEILITDNLIRFSSVQDQDIPTFSNLGYSPERTEAMLKGPTFYQHGGPNKVDFDSILHTP